MMNSTSSLNITKLFSRHFELRNEEELVLYQSEIGDVGCVVWDAAIVLCRYLLKSAASAQSEKTLPTANSQTDIVHHGVSIKGRSVLELGSGTGAVGLVAASLGANAVVTDLPEFVPLMQHNIQVNTRLLKGTCLTHPLVWGNKQQMEAVRDSNFQDGVNLILLSDCVYYEESLKELVETVLYFSSQKTTVFCSYEDRDLGNKEELQKQFLQRMSHHFEAEEIPLSSQDPEYSSPDIHIVKFVLRTS